MSSNTFTPGQVAHRTLFPPEEPYFQPVRLTRPSRAGLSPKVVAPGVARVTVWRHPEYDDRFKVETLCGDINALFGGSWSFT